MVLAYGDIPEGKLLDDEEYKMTEQNLMNYFPENDHICMCLLNVQKTILFGCALLGIIGIILSLSYACCVRYIVNQKIQVAFTLISFNKLKKANNLLINVIIKNIKEIFNDIKFVSSWSIVTRYSKIDYEY